MYYIKQRNNPQLPKPYYVAYGKLTKKEAKEIEKSIYGTNTMLAYSSKEEYKEKYQRKGHNGMGEGK